MEQAKEELLTRLRALEEKNHPEVCEGFIDYLIADIINNRPLGYEQKAFVKEVCNAPVQSV